MRAFGHVTQMAPTRLARARLNVWFGYLLLTDRLKIRRRHPSTITLAGRSFLVKDHSEALVLGEVFADQCYADAEMPDDVDLVIDLGCNIGAASLWFADRYPSATVIGVEADPRTAELARRNSAADARIEIINAAASDSPGTATLYVADSWASSTVAGGDGDGDQVQVPAVTLDELIERGGPRRLLKIDIEGAEHQVLRASRGLRGVEFVTGEFHPVPGETWDGMLASLAGFAVVRSSPSADGRYTFTARRLPQA